MSDFNFIEDRKFTNERVQQFCIHPCRAAHVPCVLRLAGSCMFDPTFQPAEASGSIPYGSCRVMLNPSNAYNLVKHRVHARSNT